MRIMKQLVRYSRVMDREFSSRAADVAFLIVLLFSFLCYSYLNGGITTVDGVVSIDITSLISGIAGLCWVTIAALWGSARVTKWVLIVRDGIKHRKEFKVDVSRRIVPVWNRVTGNE